MKAIMYHYVRPDSNEYPYFKHLHIEDFKQQLDHFDKEYGFVSKDDFYSSLKTGIPPQGVILTFDDALKDHYQFVFPELQSRELWGIFYVSTGVYKHRKLLDVHRVHMLLGKFGGKFILDRLKTKIDDSQLKDKEREDFTINTYQYQTNDEYTTEVKRILNYYLDYDVKEKVLSELITELTGEESDMVNNFYLTPSEIKEMEAAGMLIGSHTVSHPVMSKLNVGEQEQEIAESFTWLDSTLNKDYFKTFCYPFGHLHTFTADTERLLEEYGSECAFTVECRDVVQEDLQNRKQALPRYDCNMFPYGQIRS